MRHPFTEIIFAKCLKIRICYFIGTHFVKVRKTTHHIYVIELKLRNNGGKEAAIKQIQNRQYLEPFKADKREVVGLGIELDEEGKGVLDWEMVNEE